VDAGRELAAAGALDDRMPARAPQEPGCDASVHVAAIPLVAMIVDLMTKVDD
jgi:hypothetical protein